MLPRQTSCYRGCSLQIPLKAQWLVFRGRQRCGPSCNTLLTTQSGIIKSKRNNFLTRGVYNSGINFVTQIVVMIQEPRQTHFLFNIIIFASIIFLIFLIRYLWHVLHQPEVNGFVSCNVILIHEAGLITLAAFTILLLSCAKSSNLLVPVARFEWTYIQAGTKM